MLRTGSCITKWTLCHNCSEVVFSAILREFEFAVHCCSLVNQSINQRLNLTSNLLIAKLLISGKKKVKGGINFLNCSSTRGIFPPENHVTLLSNCTARRSKDSHFFSCFQSKSHLKEPQLVPKENQDSSVLNGQNA